MTDRLALALEELAAAIRAEVAAAVQPAGPERLLDVESAAEALSVGRSTVYEEIRSGRLRSCKVGRRRLVPESALAAYTETPAPVSETFGSGLGGRRRDRRSPSAA